LKEFWEWGVELFGRARELTRAKKENSKKKDSRMMVKKELIFLNHFLGKQFKREIKSP